MHQCDGQRWVVTGGTRGIGRALVLAVAHRGAEVAFCGRVSSTSAAREVLEAAGSDLARRLHFVPANVSCEDDVERLFDEAVERLGGLDVVVNNAGVSHDRLLVETTLEEWNEVLGVNVRGAYLVMRRAVEQFLASGSGRIVNVASIAVNGNVGQGAYSASKSALLAMSRAVAKEYGPRGIACNTVVPGFIDTDMTASLDAVRRRQFENLSPERRFGTAAEVVEAILFLASVEASFVTGDELWVAGAVRDVPRLGA